MSTLGQGANNRARPGTSQAELKVSVPASPEAGGALRRAIRSLDRWLGPQTADDVELLVTELATNGVKHARTRNGGRITLDASVEPGLLRVEVRDGGHGFTHTRRRPDRSEPGGWGLMLVDDLADRWGIEGEPTTTVWFEITPRRAA
jgi:anti-sigma regulatory factor (Ser/Thr protein kinase)